MIKTRLISNNGTVSQTYISEYKPSVLVVHDKNFDVLRILNKTEVSNFKDEVISVYEFDKWINNMIVYKEK